MSSIRSTALAGAALSVAVVLAPPAAQARTAPVGPSVSSLVRKNQLVTVKGKVKLRNPTAKRRRATRVTIKLSDAKKHVERRVLKINRKLRFSSSRKTKLSGAVSVRVSAAVAGKRFGRVVTRKITVSAKGAPAKRPGATNPTTPAARPNAVRLSDGPLKGTFRIAPGDGSRDTTTGSYFQMLQGNGDPLKNGSSTAKDQTTTLFTPGTDGGLTTGGYQPAPNPAFDNSLMANALAARIIKPVSFFGTDFSVVTEPTDIQTGEADPVPAIQLSAGRLSGQVTAWGAQWNNQSFNQGTPKPDGSSPGATTPLSGTYNYDSGRYTLDWKSYIVGGPFNGFTGRWHLEGVFAPQ